MKRAVLAALALPVVTGVCFGGIVVAAAVGAAGSDGSGDSTADAPPAPGVVLSGRPCATPLETQGFRPGPGNLEPHHTGIDFACLEDRTLVALLPGSVAVARNHDCGGGFGCTVVIQSELNGRHLFVRYGHVAEGSILVEPGQTVSPGIPVATEGSTGWSTGPHVHVEVDVGAPTTDRCIDPAPFLDPAILR